MNKEIIILGGGSAGWLTALFLKKFYKNLNIKVIEDPATPPIIAGESGSAGFNSLLDKLDINFDEWINAVNALPKLGGKLVNWAEAGNNFNHSLALPGFDNLFALSKCSTNLAVHSHFLSIALAENTPFEEILYCSALMQLGKIPSIITEDKKIVDITRPMYHFDSRANAAYLKNIGISRDIKLIEGRYTSSTRKENGDINSIKLLDGVELSADWFFDCSGFARLLTKKELDINFIDYSNYFPARSVVAWWKDTVELKPYTEITALKYGWSWNINLQHRSGNGYLYDHDHITVDQAIEEAENYFNTKIEPVANLKFTPCLAETTWNNNVIAIGISSGFLEPLESNGLGQITMQLDLLDKFWNPLSNLAGEQSRYNTHQSDYAMDILLFLSLHYRGRRKDSDFWISHTTDKFRVPDVLQDRLELWSNGIFADDIGNGRMFSPENWVQIIQGLNLIDRKKLKNDILSKNPKYFEFFYKNQELLKSKIKKITKDCCTITDWLKTK